MCREKLSELCGLSELSVVELTDVYCTNFYYNRTQENTQNKHDLNKKKILTIVIK